MTPSSSQPHPEAFCINLRFLCGFYKSVAEVCRRLEINRQQFNKYLGGQTVPSSFNLRKICTFFGVDEEEIFSAPDRFAALFERKQESPAQESVVPEGFFPDSTDDLSKYLGYYFGYTVSPSFPGEVIKSLTRLSRNGKRVESKTYERMTVGGDSREIIDIHKYRGFCFASTDLIYMVEREYMSARGFIWTALYPSHRSRFRFLNGLVAGVAGDSFRRPYGAQIVFEYLGETVDLRQTMTACGLFPIDSPEISEEVKARLLVPPAKGDFNLTPPLF